MTTDTTLTPPLYLVGLNHERTPLDVRSLFACSDEQSARLLAGICAMYDNAEAVLLSTCNRTELYVAGGPGPEKMVRILAGHAGISEEAADRCLYRKSGIEAARHLFRVAAGLDSMILGEQQILGQVKHAYSLASRLKTTGTLLNKLFHLCFRAGKRSRAETAIGLGAVSVASLSVDLLRKVIGTLNRASVLIVGAGDTARLVAQSLKSDGAGSTVIVNRTHERALALAVQTGCRAVAFDMLLHELAACDAVICAVNAPDPVISRAMLASASRNGRHAICCIDISMPRSIAVEAADVPGVTLYDLDTLNAMIDNTLSLRLAEAPRVEAIIEQELAAFDRWLRRHGELPRILQLQEHFEQIRLRELARCRKYFAEKDWEQVDRFSRSLFKKVLHHPLARLNRCRGPESTCSVCTIQDMFGIKNED